jgi:hypothetical protein
MCGNVEKLECDLLVGLECVVTKCCGRDILSLITVTFIV